MKHIANLILASLMLVGCSNTVKSDETPLDDQQMFESQKHTFTTEYVAQGLQHPWGMAFIDEHRLLVTERVGRVQLIDLRNQTSQAVAGAPETVSEGQGGMLDIALHPDFAQNQLVYISYVAKELVGSGMGTEVALARLVLPKSSDAQESLQQNSQSIQSGTPEFKDVKVLFKALPKSRGSRHFGGRLAVNAQHVYLSLGDRGQREWAQDLRNHWGSIIRLSLDGTPAGNSANQESGVYSYGHRNPQGLAWHPNGQLWSHEHGPQGGDEINPLVANANYGWPLASFGEEYVTGFDIGEESIEGMLGPIYHWTPSIAPSGMTFYDGSAFKQWQGHLFVGSLKFRKIVRLELEGQKVIASEDLLIDQLGRIRDIAQGPDSLLYVLTDDINGALVRLQPAIPVHAP